MSERIVHLRKQNQKMAHDTPQKTYLTEVDNWIEAYCRLKVFQRQNAVIVTYHASPITQFMSQLNKKDRVVYVPI